MFRRDRNRGLDPRKDYTEIYQNLFFYDFPWDLNQALSFALFRTYAVPSIGELLSDTRGFDNTQKRYDDTAILLERPLASGYDSTEGRTAIRRINQMHHAYNISNDDMLYVLATFVVVPKRWIDDYGWRKLTDTEVVASVEYYRELGRHMNIKDMPATYDEFDAFMDSYEDEHFEYSPGGRRVADMTLELMTTFFPSPARPAVDMFSRALMDPALLDAFQYKHPPAWFQKLSYLAMRGRANFVRLLPPRRKPVKFEEGRRQRSYRPGNIATDCLGTFPTTSGTGCPVPHTPHTAA